MQNSHSAVLACPKAVKLDEPTSDLACKFAGDPVAGLVEHLSIPNTIKQGMAYYVAILAATILIIATNAGIIGVSRLTYSMGQHRQLPEAIRHVHPKFNTPYVAIILYSVIAVILMIPPGAIAFLGNLYAFGAMLSFTLAHASVIKMRRTLELGRHALARPAVVPGRLIRPAALRRARASSAAGPRGWSPSRCTSRTASRRSGSPGSPSGWSCTSSTAALSTCR